MIWVPPVLKDEGANPVPTLRSHFFESTAAGVAKTIVSTYGSAMRHVNIRAILLVTLAVFGIDFVSSAVLFGVFGGPPLSATPQQIRIALAERAQAM